MSVKRSAGGSRHAMYGAKSKSIGPSVRTRLAVRSALGTALSVELLTGLPVKSARANGVRRMDGHQHDLYGG